MSTGPAGEDVLLERNTESFWWRVAIPLLLLSTVPTATGMAQDSLAQKGIVPAGSVLIQVFTYSKLDVTPKAQQSMSFGCTRAHVGYAYTFNRNFAATVVVDASGRPTTVGSVIVRDTSGHTLQASASGSDGSSYTAFLKYAFIQWHPNDETTLVFGGIPQNHYITQEKFWGYRYVYETFQDRYYGTASGDWGAIGYWRVAPSIGIDAAVTNGEGIRAKQDAHGSLKLAAGIDVISGSGMVIRLYFDNLASGDSIRSATQNVISLFAGYKVENQFRVGLDAVLPESMWLHFELSAIDLELVKRSVSFTFNEMT